MSLAPCRLARVCDTDLPLPALQPLAEAVFGAETRAPGWFVRKLAREAVDPRRSFLAFGTGDAPIGYVLLGDEPGENMAHSAGLGVLLEHRGRGVGSALIEHAVAALRGAMPVLQILAEPPRRRFYERLGFVAARVCHTLQSAARGTASLDLREQPPAAWALPGHAIAGWRAGTWSRTPSAEAATLSLLDGAAWVHVSRENRAILVQRMCVADGSSTEILARTHAALDELRGRFVRGTAILMYGCEAVSCVTASLLHGDTWRVVQTALEMRRAIGEGVDKQARPTA